MSVGTGSHLLQDMNTTYPDFIKVYIKQKHKKNENKEKKKFFYQNEVSFQFLTSSQNSTRLRSQEKHLDNWQEQTTARVVAAAWRGPYLIINYFENFYPYITCHIMTH